ncbi:hypothetical protein HRTV-11_gp106 [Halorubrum virus HRTV-11]|nr:hypothetical protein HRTV-11_gp106 [Halorubrum virus HRTV-11]
MGWGVVVAAEYLKGVWPPYGGATTLSSTPNPTYLKQAPSRPSGDAEASLTGRGCGSRHAPPNTSHLGTSPDVTLAGTVSETRTRW